MNKDALAALAKYFESNWQPMLENMGRARAIEFRIRLAAEVQANTAFRKARSWEEFGKGARQVERRKLEKLIREIFPSSADRMILIRQCADGLAHADYRAARLRIDQYKARFGLSAPLSTEKIGIFLYRDVLHPDGVIADLGYLLTSSDENLILEEYEVFSRQGYVSAAGELMSFAEQQLAEAVSRLDVKYAALVASRGLKYGTRA